MPLDIRLFASEQQATVPLRLAAALQSDRADLIPGGTDALQLLTSITSEEGANLIRGVILISDGRQTAAGDVAGTAQRLASQLNEAKWLIKNVRQRFDTILRVSCAIVERQRQFFDHGAVAMRPLVLREIADELELHESTVSRVTTQKFMRTPRGTFELKYFFGSHVATDTGGACSATAIRALIKQFISGENIKKPLSDSQISEILGQQGIVVARRTVAKYRESMQIPPVSLRKSF